jgi:hypothetical protein
VTVLNLGVISQPYRTPGQRQHGKTGKPGKKRKAQISAITTYDVAKILEARYHVMEVFFEAHAEEIAEMMVKAYAGALETALMRFQMPVDLAATGISQIKKAFNSFLDQGEMEQMGIPGVPTLAALHGVSHRFKHPYARRAARPSFIDTGLYESSFIAWVE